jgi:hypothetical protein
MAEAASAQQAASATAEDTSQQRAGRRRRTSTEPQRAQHGATAAAAPGALDTLIRLQQLADAIPQAAQLRRLQALVDASPQVAQLQRLQALADASPQAVQLRRLQALADNHYAPVAQLAGDPEEEGLVQGQFASAELQPQLQQAPRANNTGLPDQLKSGIESLSGLSMDHVRVHYNSSQPAQLNALAYAQGSDIHLAPGQEHHLPHEAWHIVQQRQARVRATVQLGGQALNDDPSLEHEADAMGSKALQMKDASTAPNARTPDSGSEGPMQRKDRRADRATRQFSADTAPVQRMKFSYEESDVKETRGVKEKLDQVIPILTQTVANFGSDKATVNFRLINEGGMSPAFSSSEAGSGSRYSGNVVITLNRWYAQRASVGDIVGMLVHELGVHSMADFHMGMDTDGRAAATFSIIKERTTEKDTHTLDGKTHGLSYGSHTLAPIDRKQGDRRQEDHVNVGKGLISEEADSRAQVYLQTFLAAGKAIDDNKEIPTKERKTRLRDLIQSFFFDLARIVATDDGKPLSMFSKATAIAELMNFYQKQVIENYGSGHPWLKDDALKLDASDWGLRKRLLGLIGELTLSSNPSVQKVRGILGGGLVATGAYLLGGLTAGPALGLGLATGLTIWGGAKLLSY